MIEYILKLYGINCQNKWFGFFTTGLTLSLFSSTFFILKFLKSPTDITSEVLFKLFLIINIVSKLFNYLMIKYKSTELFELNMKLEKFQNKCRISQKNIQIFTIFSVILSALTAFCATNIYFYVSDIITLFEDDKKIDSLPVSSFFQAFVLAFYHYLWYFSVHLLYIEFKTRYISIIKEFKINVINEKSEPDSDVLKLTQKYVLKFVNFKNDIKRNVDFLKYGISMEFISCVALIICCHVLSKKSKFSYYHIFGSILLFCYYLWTMSCNLRIRIIDNDLSFTLNKWLHLNPEDSIQIEMDYTEKTVKPFNQKESSDETE